MQCSQGFDHSAQIAFRLSSGWRDAQYLSRTRQAPAQGRIAGSLTQQEIPHNGWVEPKRRRQRRSPWRGCLRRSRGSSRFRVQPSCTAWRRTWRRCACADRRRPARDRGRGRKDRGARRLLSRAPRANDGPLSGGRILFSEPLSDPARACRAARRRERTCPWSNAVTELAKADLKNALYQRTHFCI